MTADSTIHPANREQLIEQHMIIVQRIAGKLLRRGQNSAVEKDDLLQVGYAEMICTIDRLPPPDAPPLDKRIARNCLTVMLRFIQEQVREHRYVQCGRDKADRDRLVGVSARDRRIEALAIRADAQDAEAGPELDERADFFDDDESLHGPEGKYTYQDWLRGSVSVVQNRRAYHHQEIQECDLPEELAELAHRIGYRFKETQSRDRSFYQRPVLDCLKA